jgi:hypothetical protein
MEEKKMNFGTATAAAVPEKNVQDGPVGVGKAHLIAGGQEDHDFKLDFKGGEGTTKSVGIESLNNWYELRFPSLGPDRRGYHSTFVHNKRLFIYGGHDIREGSKDSLWMLDLKKLRDMELE